jgi:vacuolar-type H+-ATPase subunit H
MVQKEVEKVKKAEKDALKEIDDAKKKKEWIIKKADEKAEAEREALIFKAKLMGRN